MTKYSILSLTNKSQVKAVTALLILLIITIGFFYYQNEIKSIRQNAFDDLKTVSALKIDQLVKWKNERNSDIKVIAKSPFFINAIEDWVNSKMNSQLEKNIEKRLDIVQKEYNYDAIFITDLDGELLLNVGQGVEHMHLIVKNKIKEAIEAQTIIFTDFYLCEEHQQINYDIIAPIINAENKTIAVLIFRISPKEFLYPLIQSWPVESKSSECLLVRKDGDSILYLNDLRFKQNTACRLKNPISNNLLPAVQAVKGITGLFDGKDYRNHRVLAYLNAVPGTNWYMVVKMDKSELLDDFYFEAIILIIFTFLLVLLLTAGAAFIYNKRQKNIFKSLWQTQQEFKTTLYSIGDAVIVTDKIGKIKILNQVAEKLTGWTESEALDLMIDDVFNIIDEDNREKVESPAAKVLREGLVVGLANHTLLISKDGNEIAIADSGAPLKDKDGNIDGVVIVFRDQAMEREKQKILEIRLSLFEYASKHTLAELLTKTLDEIGKLTNSPIGFYHFVNPDQETLSLQEWSTQTKLEFCKAEGKGLHYHISDAGVWVDCVRQRKAVIHNDYESLPNKKGMPEGHAKVTRELVVPIFRDQQIVAILGIGNKPTDYTEKDVELATYLADIAWEVTEKKRLEESFFESEERSRLILESSMDAILFTDPTNGSVLSANPAACEIFQMSEEEICKRGRDGLLNLEDIRLMPLIEERKIKGKAIGEITMIKKDGTIFPVEVSSSLFLNSDGKIRTSMIIRDITRRKKAEDEKKETLILMKNLSDRVPGVIYQYQLNPDGSSCFPYSSEGMNMVYEYTPEEVRKDATPVFSRLHPEDIQYVSDLIFESAKTLNHFHCEFRVVLPKQGLRWRCSDAKPERLEDGGTLWHGIIYDITDRKEVEIALREKTDFIDKIIETSALSTWISDDKGTALRANLACFDFFGAKEEEVIGKYNLFKDEEIKKQGFLPDIQRVFEKGEVANIVLDYDFGSVEHVNVKNATHRIINSIFTPILDSNGKVTNVIVQTIDLTEIKNKELQLKESESKFATAFNSSPVSMSLVSVESGLYEDVNASFTKDTFFKREDIIGKSPAELGLSENAEEIKTQLKVHADEVREKGLSDSFPFKWKAKDGQIKEFLLSTCIVCINNESFFLSSIIDVTERKKMELELRSKMEELERWYTATLGREERNIQLKREVNELLQSIGQPPKYQSI